jgi:succinate-semialdehyde dehydrogenase / glutarate-semialdehyde dehydrogenase
VTRQTSDKRGLRSAGQKQAASRHDIAPMPATQPVPGAFGKPRQSVRGRQSRSAGARGGRPAAHEPGAPIVSINPATGKVLGTFAVLGAEEIAERVGRAERAFGEQRRVPVTDRAQALKRVADILEEKREAFARQMTVEMGKPIRAAREEVTKCAWCCRFYGDHAEGWLADESVATSAGSSFIRYEPLGPVLAIMPWNFPFWQVVRFAAPALVAGNVVLLKHASNVPQCALAIEQVFRDAGFSDGAFQTLRITPSQVEGVLDDPRVVAVTLTGSERAGREIGRQAGARVKKSVLELGGSDPFIVMPSADLEAAVETAVTARMLNSGQSCVAAKRFIIAEPIAEPFERRFVERVGRLQIGDPGDPATEVGPLATADILATLERQVQASVARGARMLVGGRRLARSGYYYAPTVLADVPADAPAAQEELFGPVAALFRARDATHAIEIANNTPFGLGASAWTRDAGERTRFVEELEAGLVFVNAMVASDPRLPFGGVKRSGYGRELGLVGLREFVNVKTVWIADPGVDARGQAE